MRHELDPLTRSPQAEQEVDAEVGMLLATQLRELLRGQSLDAYQSRVIPGVLRVLRLGATKSIRLRAAFGSSGGNAESMLPELLEASWSSVLIKELNAGVREDALAPFLDAMLLAQAQGSPETTCEAFFDRFKPKTSQGLCGYLFQRNDIAFNCRTCQLDETCVLCLKCYQNGNHEGHDVTFHRTLPGGMCDCGDAEAWDPDGFCIYHGNHDQEVDAVPLPPNVTQVADALFEEIVNFFVEMAKASIDSFDPDKVDRNGRIMLEQYRVLHEAEITNVCPLPSSPTQQRRLLSAWSPRFHVRICNDDVHSDEDLVSSLSKKHIREARRLVRSIDSNGSELIASNLKLRDALALMQQLKTEGWHVCVVHDQHIRDENILIRVIQWVKNICALSRPLHKMFCDKLFSTTNAVAAPKEPIQVMFLSDPYFRKEIVTVLYELYLKLQSDKDPKLQFSIVFLKVYNRLMVKYFCGIGTRDETLFGYGVQIFTTPSIVNRLAGLGLIEILLDTMTTSLDLAKTSTLTGAASLAAKSTLNSSPSSSLSVPTRTLDCEHSILKFKRFSFILDHLGYVMNIPAMTSEMFLNKDQLRKWYSSLRQMQGFDPQVRIQDGHAHVTYETGTWFTAFNFHSYISRLMTTLCKGLRQHEGTIEEKAAMVRNVMDGYWEQLEFGGITDPNIAMHSPSFGFGVGSPFSDTIVKYDVASQPVSFHYPLHGFLANFLLECMYYGPEISDWKLFIENSLRVLDDADAEAGHDDDETRRRRKKMLVYGMMEFPLRTLVLCAQIQSGLWIRNGQSMHRQMLHYANPPLCSELRDLDLLLVQISSCVLGFTKFLGIYFDRFGLMDWLHTWNTNGQDTYRESTFTMGDEKLVALLEGALLHMIWLVTELPPPMEDIKERDVWLRREIVHRLSQHPCRLSELLDQTGFMTSTPFGGVSSPQGNEHLARLESILEDIADVQVRSRIGQDEDGVDPGAMEPTKYVLKKEFYREYDPAFYHLARSAHEKAQFARQEALFKHWKVEDDPIPLVQHLPPVHSSLASVRLLVCEKGLLGILRLVLEDATSQTTPKKTNVMVILRTIHLLSLVVLVLRNENPKLGATLVDTKKRRVLGHLRSGPDAFEESEWTGSRGKKRYKRQNDESFDGDVQMSSDSDQGDLTEVQDLSIVSLLVTFAKDQVEHDFDTSKSTISAIYWILKELAALDATIHIFVQENVWKGMKKAEDHTADNGLSKAQLKKLHQQRAIEAMMAKQKAFAQSSMFAEMDEFDEDDEDDLGGDRVADGDDGVVSGSTIVYRPPPPPECIICTQKKKKEPVMYIGHAQTSQVNVHALQEKPFPAAPLSETFPPPLFLTLCGHAVHLQCWKKYFDSVKAQSRYNLEHSQSNIAFDAHFGEFLCPLCQSLSSMLVPHVPPSKTLTHDEQQRDRDAMERVFQAKQDTTSVLLWLTDGLPSRLIALEGESEFEDIEIDVDDDIGTGTADTDDDDEQDENHGTAGVRQEDDVRAMKQFAVSFLEALSRFQPDMTHMTATIANLKKSFISTGPQLTHLMWSAVTSTCTSVQLSGVSAAVFALEAANSPTETFLARRRLPRNSPPGRASSSSSPLGSGTGGTGSLASTSASSFSSLRITSILNPPLPSLKSRLAVGLPESLDASLDHFSPKDDGKLNCLLRSLRRVSLLFKNRKQDFYRTMVLPILRGLRLNLGAEEWMGSLSRGAPLQLGQPILSQDLFYLCVAVCSSMLHTKADILLTIRSMCVLHMAQVLLQIARMTAEEQDDYEDDSETTDRIDEDGNQQSKREPMTPREKETAHHLSILMERLSVGAGVDVLARAERDGAPYSPPRGSQLLYMFQSSSLAFMRQVTLLCRGFFRGEHDPDASNYANFVSSLRLSTNYNEMCQQLGLPSVEQVLADQSLMSYLDQAATQLRTSRLACIPDDVQFDYRQHGHVDGVLQAIDEQAVAVATAEGESESERISVILRNLNQLPALPIRCIEDASTTRQFYYANVRLVRLQPLYTDLHSEVLARSRCPTTDKLVENPAICLVCEQVLCAGTDCCRRQSDNMGACTAHAISCGYGVGLFFLMRSSSVLLVFGPRSSYFGSPYLDMFGEEDINLRRGRPLYLNSKRMKALLTLYANHQLANEVARNRRTSDQYIRNNYY